MQLQKNVGSQSTNVQRVTGSKVKNCSDARSDRANSSLGVFFFETEKEATVTQWESWEQ